MILLVVFVLIGVLIAVLGVALARDPGPSLDEIALAYETAWDRLDFATLWLLSGPELRDGRTRKDYVDAKQRAYQGRNDLAGLALQIGVDDVTRGPGSASVTTRVELRDGSVVHDEVLLGRRRNRWEVVGYVLSESGPARPRP